MPPLLETQVVSTKQVKMNFGNENTAYADPSRGVSSPEAADRLMPKGGILSSKVFWRHEAQARARWDPGTPAP